MKKLFITAAIAIFSMASAHALTRLRGLAGFEDTPSL
jgi:hypothetical protein